MSTALDKFSLKGRTAVVTGGSCGLGYNMARILAAAGAKVLISGRSEPSLKQAAANLAKSENAQVVYATVDLADRESVKAFISKADELLGQVDIYIGNAAMLSTHQVDDLDEDLMDQILATNLTANMLLTKYFSPGMKKRGWGRIIYISSIGAKRSGIFGIGPYSATKAGLDAYARTASVELGRSGITVNSILPGAYLTEMLQEGLDSMGEEEAKAFKQGLPAMNSLGRLGNPEEIEGLILLLASDAGSYISGQSISADGGYSIKADPS